MVAFLPIALAAAGALASFSRENQYMPEGQSNSTGNAWLNILGGGLGGYAAGGGLSGLGGASGPSQAIGADQLAGAGATQAGSPGFIPIEQLTKQAAGGVPASNFNELLLQQGGLPQGLGLGGQPQNDYLQNIRNQQFLNAQRGGGLRYGGY